MQAIASPGSLITIAGAVMTVVGSIAYVTDSPTLSLAGVFYGVPVLLGGLALKSSELPPAELIEPSAEAEALRTAEASQPLRKLVKDVNRWRYGQKAHLERQAEAGGYGLDLTFQCQGVSFERWQARQDRLGRFFGPGLRAEVSPLGKSKVLVRLRPQVDTAPVAEVGEGPSGT
ncbi:MAG: DUF2854 domain-containing protein [Cyanobacteria bacterium]|nr:DUF2854 domain-containing protein [Cyanobacteriota bacterium]